MIADPPKKNIGTVERANGVAARAPSRSGEQDARFLLIDVFADRCENVSRIGNNGARLMREHEGSLRRVLDGAQGFLIYERRSLGLLRNEIRFRICPGVALTHHPTKPGSRPYFATVWIDIDHARATRVEVTPANIADPSTGCGETFKVTAERDAEKPSTLGQMLKAVGTAAALATAAGFPNPHHIAIRFPCGGEWSHFC